MHLEQFTEKHVEEAAKLFLIDYVEIKRKYPYLPETFNKVDNICSNLSKIIAENPSIIAIESNRIVGYLTGYSNIKELKGSASGSYVPEWAHCANHDDADRIYGKLYTEMSRIWTGNRNLTHIISFLTDNELAQTFNMLGFGMQVIDAVKPLDNLKRSHLRGFAIERADENHISQLREFDLLMNEHLESPPIFLKRSDEKASEEQISRDFLSDDVITLVAIKNKEIISCIRGKKNSGNIPILDDKGTFGINFGYTRSEYRSSGIASVLLNEILNRAKDEGAGFSSVDFESQNIEGRTFWLKHFEPLVYSMMRKVDDRVNIIM